MLQTFYSIQESLEWRQFSGSAIPSVVNFDRSADKTLKKYPVRVHWKNNGVETVFTQQLLINLIKSYNEMANNALN